MIKVILIYVLFPIFYAGCNLKDEHTNIGMKNVDSLKTVATLTEINEIWIKIDKQQNLLTQLIQSGKRNHLETPVEEIILLSKVLLNLHKDINTEKKDMIVGIINKIKMSGENIETYNKNKDENMLLQELNNFNSLTKEMKRIYSK